MAAVPVSGSGCRREVWNKAVNNALPQFDKGQEGRWTGPFSFVQGADPQFGLFDDYMRRDRDLKVLAVSDDLEWDEEVRRVHLCVDAVNRLTPRPRFFAVCGDFVHAWPFDVKGGRQRAAQLKDLRRAFSGLHPDIALVCVCGNHDVGNSPTPGSVLKYRDEFGDDFFSFWCSGVKFIVINSQYYHDDGHVRTLSSEHGAWLDRELAEIGTSGCRHAVVFQHIPWFLETPGEEDAYFNIRKERRMEMLEKLRQAGVSKIFAGHYHREAGGFYKGVEQVVTTAIGCQIGPDEPAIKLVSVTEENITHSNIHFMPAGEKIPERMD